MLPPEPPSDCISCDQQEKPEIWSLIHCINLICPENCVGAEIGVSDAKSFNVILQSCSIEKLYGVDSYKPYDEFIVWGDGDDENDYSKKNNLPTYSVDEYQIDYIKLLSEFRIKWSGQSRKVCFLEKDSSEALNDIQDNELDFIFIDSYTCHESATKELINWYPKVKTGGLIMGHDYHCKQVKQAVEKMLKHYQIAPKISDFDESFCFIK